MVWPCRGWKRNQYPVGDHRINRIIPRLSVPKLPESISHPKLQSFAQRGRFPHDFDSQELLVDYRALAIVGRNTNQPLSSCPFDDMGLMVRVGPA